MAPRPQPSRKPQGSPRTGEPAKADNEAEDQQDVADEAESDADEGEDGDADLEVETDGEEDSETDDGEDKLNDPVEPSDLTPPVRKSAALPKAPVIPKGHVAILSTPQGFGIHIPVWGEDDDGKRILVSSHLHTFRKGKTPLTQEQHDALATDPYTKDNRAEILYRKK